MINTGVIEVDLHGMTVEEAKKCIDSKLRATGKSVYRLRLVHGYHGGTGIKSMIREEYSYGRDERVLRVEGGWNDGITELVLREL